MFKGAKIILLSLFLLAFAFSVSFGIETVDYTIWKPLNNTFNSSTNTTQPFIFKYTNTTNLTAPCTLYVNSVAVASNSSRSAQNNTLNSNASFNEGYNSWYVSCINGTSNNQPSGVYDLIIDTTAPTVLQLSVVPEDGLNTTNSTIRFTMRGLDNIGDYYNAKAARFDIMINGTNNLSQYYYANETDFSFTIAGFYDGLYQYNGSIRDNRTNEKNTTLRWFRVDSTSPTMGTPTASNVSGGTNMTARVNFTTNDAQLPTNAYVTIFSNNTAVNRSGTHTTNTSGRYIMHQFDLSPSDIPYDGYFVVQPHGNDTLGNDGTGTNQTNWTKISLSGSKWSLIQLDRNQSLINVSNYSTAISKVSWYNTTSGAFQTFTVGSGTNSLVTAVDGDSVYVYATADSGLLRKWSFEGGAKRNVTMATGWNFLSAWNTSAQMWQLCDTPIDNSSAALKTIAVFDTASQTYQSQTCSIATGNNNNLTVVRGRGLVFRFNTTTTMGLYR